MAAPTKAKVSVFALLADELGALEKEMAPHAQKLARIEALKKTLRMGCTAPADESWTVEGSRFVAMLGPRANERSIDFKSLVKAITAGAFAKFATCSLKALEENVSPATAAAVVSVSPTGSRSLKTFERGSV